MQRVGRLAVEGAQGHAGRQGLAIERLTKGVEHAAQQGFSHGNEGGALHDFNFGAHRDALQVAQRHEDGFVLMQADDFGAQRSGVRACRVADKALLANDGL